MDFVVLLAPDRIVLGFDPQLCIMWIQMMGTGVWMVSIDQDYSFSGQHLLQLGIRLGYFIVVSRVFCEGLYAVWLDRRGGNSSIIDIFYLIIVQKCFKASK